MRKFAAHYLLTHQGLLLKNGMAVVQESGTIQFIDTKGELAEMEQMIFHSGLLIGPFEYIKRKDPPSLSSGTEKPMPLLDSVLNKDHLSLKEVLDLAMQLQGQFPEMNVPGILNKIEQAFLSGAFIKNTVTGLYLLSGLDLGNLHFTPATRLKKII